MGLLCRAVCLALGLFLCLDPFGFGGLLGLLLAADVLGQNDLLYAGE